MNCELNDMFYGRLTGDRFQEYYGGKNNISNQFDQKVTLNGHRFNKTPNQIINELKYKYSTLADKGMTDSFLGHGDWHHQNILCGNSQNIKFIDFEYFGYHPINMEISKAYYIDFLGTLFFYFQDRLENCFEIIKREEDSDNLRFNIKYFGNLDLRLEILKNKIDVFGDLLKSGDDYLTLNDYLIICHLLSRNPNLYSKNCQDLFLSMIPVFDSFDPLNPKSFIECFS